jgi:lysophospholipase L1-like esterase
VADQPPIPGQRSLPRKLSLIVTGLVLALLLSEGMTRLLVPDPPFRRENEIHMFREDPFAGYRNKPNVHDHVYGFIPVDTNSMGFRGPEISLRKAPGTYRILGLGDSVTWGTKVREPDTFLRVVEREVQKNSGVSRGVLFEAVNSGVVGYSTYQELVTLEHYGLPLCPDLVIVGFVHNDSYPTEDPFNNAARLHQPPNPKPGRFISPPEVVYPLKFLTFLRAVVKRKWAALQEQPKVPDGSMLGNWMADSFAMLSWPVLQGHLRRLQALGEANGFHVLVVLFPTHHQVYYGQGAHAYQNVVGPFLAAEKIAYIDLYDVFRAARTKQQFTDWVHPNVAGHQTAASEILRYLRESHWLDGVSPATLQKCAASERLALAP